MTILGTLTQEHNSSSAHFAWEQYRARSSLLLNRGGTWDLIIAHTLRQKSKAPLLSTAAILMHRSETWNSNPWCLGVLSCCCYCIVLKAEEWGQKKCLEKTECGSKLIYYQGSKDGYSIPFPLSSFSIVEPLLYHTEYLGQSSMNSQAGKKSY